MLSRNFYTEIYNKSLRCINLNDFIRARFLFVFIKKIINLNF